MDNKHRKTLTDVFTNPVPADIPWTDIIKLLTALGATITQGKGSRVRVLLNGQRAVFHEPHPERETDRGAVKSVRDFLINAGIESEAE
jgi:HicA toxin of bacterial toxin-antitoxin,